MTFQSKRGERDGNATESGDDQAGSPLHVLSDVAQKECQWGASPEAAAVDGAQNRAFSRTQTRHIGSTASAAPSGLGELVAAKALVQPVTSRIVMDLQALHNLLTCVTTAIKHEKFAEGLAQASI